jgi:hypothetical protein
MKRLFTSLIIAITAITGFKAQAQKLIDTDTPDQLIRVGVRVGWNSSNLTNNYEKIVSGTQWKDNQWRSGFNIGAVVDINFRNFFALQPGAFIVTRRNNYHLLTVNGNTLESYNGTHSANYLQVPVLASFRLGVAEYAQLQLDCGPYLAWGWGGSNKCTYYTSGDELLKPTTTKQPYFGDSSNTLCERFDYGLKYGVGARALDKFYIGAHYSYGLRNAMKQAGYKGHNKMWSFTLGYDF